MIRKIRMCLVFTLVVLMALSLFPGTALAASPPEPTYGSATVDGDSGDWAPGDFFAAMYKAGDPTKEVLSKLYLRYDCDSDPQLLYVLVLVEDGFDGKADAAEAWMKAYDVSTSVLPWNEFEWVGEDVAAGTVLGYEASVALAPGTYTTEKIEVHIQVDPDETSSTGRPLENRIDLVINCDGPGGQEIPSVPGVSVWGGLAMAGAVGLITVYMMKRRQARLTE